MWERRESVVDIVSDGDEGGRMKVEGGSTKFNFVGDLPCSTLVAMRWPISIKLIFLFCIVVFHITCQAPQEDVIRVATASNMQYAIKEIAAVFQDKTGIETELIITSSGKLTAQIIAGAPYDVFLSADMKYPNQLHQQGILTLPPKVYATGKLVIWSLTEATKPSLATLANTRVKHVATANADTAPYGRAALEVLQSSGMLDQVKHKLVYGESISQVNQFITSKSSELGFTSLSTVLSSQIKEQGVWTELDLSLYEPIEQAAALINRGQESNHDAKQFYTFLFSPEAKTILKDFGYSIYE